MLARSFSSRGQKGSLKNDTRALKTSLSANRVAWPGVGQMSYTAAINQAKPTAFLFLIDQSRSMNEKMDAGETKAQFVGDVLNKTLLQLMTRCASADGVRDYFDIGVLAYNAIGA